MRANLLLLTVPLVLASAQTVESRRPDMAVRVPGTANPYLAGLTSGTSSHGDRAPQQSPVLVEVFLGDAAYVTFKPSGQVQHHPFWPPRFSSPSGGLLTTHPAERGISEASLPIESLLGLFLDDDRPDRSRAPRRTDSRFVDSNAVSVEPELKQIFYIGEGQVTRRGASGKKESVARQFAIPKGATRLYLGVMDEYEWNNNQGYFDVTVTLVRPGASSSIRFARWVCSPGRSLCTPDESLVETKGPGQYHVVLPAQLEWGVSVPNPGGRGVLISEAAGTVCLDADSRRMSMCNGPQGTGRLAGTGFLSPGRAAGELIFKTEGGRTYFSVNDRSGAAFQNHQGYFEFDVAIK